MKINIYVVYYSMECTDGGIVDSSNSSSDLDCYVDDDRGQGVEELTLQDDENSVLLVQPPEAVECGGRHFSLIILNCSE